MSTPQRSNSTRQIPARRSSSARPPQRRRRRKKNTNNYLYIALALCFVALALFGVLIYQISDDPDTDENISHSAEESLNNSTADTSNPDVFETSDVSLPPEESKPDDVSSPEQPDVSEPAADTKPQSTAKYEKYIGVEYAIDMTEYEKFVCPDNEENFVYIVNPDFPLSSSYVPENLVWCTNIREGRPKQWSYIDATANEALEAFLKEAAYYGYDDITVTNAYRSYDSQADLFNGYVDADIKQDYKCDTCKTYIDYSYYPNKVTTLYYCKGCGSEISETDGEFSCEICIMTMESPETKACCSTCKTVLRRPTRDETVAHVLTYSTRPGTSEHQSGLCCDMHNLATTTSAFDNTPEAKWLAANAHRFGFILRYPPNTQHITGIKHESWHFRYVGRTAATEMYEKGLTLEEYLGVK